MVHPTIPPHKMWVLFSVHCKYFLCRLSLHECVVSFTFSGMWSTFYIYLLPAVSYVLWSHIIFRITTHLIAQQYDTVTRLFLVGFLPSDQADRYYRFSSSRGASVLLFLVIGITSQTFPQIHTISELLNSKFISPNLSVKNVPCPGYIYDNSPHRATKLRKNRSPYYAC